MLECVSMNTCLCLANMILVYLPDQFRLDILQSTCLFCGLYTSWVRKMLDYFIFIEYFDLQLSLTNQSVTPITLTLYPVTHNL